MQKETENHVSVLDSLQTKIIGKGQSRVKQILQLINQFLCGSDYYVSRTSTVELPSYCWLDILCSIPDMSS